MSFARSSIRRPSNPRTGMVVHAIGQRVYVAGPKDGPTHVELMDEGGTTTIANLLDGAEVMIVAWRPRGSSGIRYCVRSTEGGLEGWLAAANLRRSRAATPPPTEPSALANAMPPVVPSSSGQDSKARFGRR